ncbi:MAG: DMT family transporter [Myxococcota bacterium]|nr:DMT family transporter [Myxococcota bacterium]MEC8423981.1 DMT family transporter [Myxococcota bacterium]
MVGAGLAFTVMVACVKVVRSELGAFEVVAWRGVVAIPLALALLRGASLRPVNRPAMALRVIAGFFAMTCFYTAAHGLSVADLSLLGRLQPVLIAIVAPVVLGRRERVDPRVWGLLGAGVLGTAVLLGPQLAVGNRYGLWAMGAVLCSGVAHLALRVLGRTEASATVVLWFQVGGTLLALLAVALSTGDLPRLPSPALLPWLAGVGAAGTAGQVLMTRAYALDRAAVVSAASHTSPLWAVIADALLFAVLPGPETLVGGGILLAAAAALVTLPSRERGR